MGFKALTALALLLATAGACTTVREVPVAVERVTRDTVWRGRLDSAVLVVRDSVSVRAVGDTVYRDRVTLAWRDRLIRDTVRTARTDTVPTLRTVTVKAAPTMRQRLAAAAGWLLAVAAVLVLAVRQFRGKQ